MPRDPIEQMTALLRADPGIWLIGVAAVAGVWFAIWLAIWVADRIFQRMEPREERRDQDAGDAYPTTYQVSEDRDVLSPTAVRVASGPPHGFVASARPQDYRALLGYITKHKRVIAETVRVKERGCWVEKPYERWARTPVMLARDWGKAVGRSERWGRQVLADLETIGIARMEQIGDSATIRIVMNERDALRRLSEVFGHE